jgi:YD repeat-containing protein
VDRAGGRWSYEYDARGSLLRRTDPAGGEASFTYTADGLMATASTAGGGVNEFAYDDLSRLKAITHADGAALHYAYYLAGHVAAVSNHLGEAWTYEYDANGNLTRAVGPTGAEKVYVYDLMDRIVTNAPSFAEATTFEYDAMGQVVRIVQGGLTNEFQRDALGNATNAIQGRIRRTAAYDASGRPSMVARDGYGHVEIQRNAQGLVTGRVDSTGFAVQAWRDPNGVVTQTVDSLARTSAWSYADGRLVSVELPGAGADERTYANGRLSAYTDRSGRTWRYGYTSEGLLAAVTNPVDGVRHYSYDLLGRMETLILEDGASWAYGYDARGGLAEITTPGTSTWRIARNALGLPLAVTNPVGGVATRTYTADGLLETFITPDAGVFSNTYDNLRRLAERTRPDGATTAYAYEPVNGWLASVTAPGGGVWGRDYDEFGRIAALVDPDGVTHSAEYDAHGRVTAAVVRAETRVAFAYDDAGRLIQTAGPDGTGRRITYDDLNRPVLVSLGGITNRFEYDAAGRLTAFSNSLAGAERYERDARGAVTSRVDAAGNTTRYERDAVGRVVEIEPPAGPSIQMAYNVEGALTRVELPGGIVETYAVDELGGLVGWTDANGETWTVERSPLGRLEATVDPLARTNRFLYNTNGWLARIEFPDGAARTYHYDPDGAVTAEVYAVAGGGAEETLTWVYDTMGTLVAADGLDLAHDAMGRVVKTVCHGVTNGAAYDAVGRLVELDYGGLMTVTYQVEPATARITNQIDSLTGAQIAYDYDAHGRLAGIRRSNGQDATFNRGADGSVTRIADGTVLDLEYSYDANGRITSVGGTWPLEAGSNLTAETNAWTYDAAGQISSAGYAYNDRGQAIATPGRTIEWIDDRPAAIDGMTMSYSGLEHLLELAGSAAPTKLYYNLGLGDVPVRENNRLYVWSPAGQLLYFVDLDNDNAVYFYHPDANGSILAISDESGTVVQTYAYDPFGRIVAESGELQQPFTFGGEHGFLRMNAFVGAAPLGKLGAGIIPLAKRDAGDKDDLFVKGKHARDGGTGDALWTDEAEIDRFIANYDALIAGEEAKIKALDEKMKSISDRISDARTYGKNPFYWTAGLILAVVDDENYWPDNAWHNYDEARRQRAFVMNRMREFEREKRKWQARKDALRPKQTPIVTAKTREIDRKIESRQDLIGRARAELRAREKEIQQEEDKLRQLKTLNKYSIPYVTDGMDKKLEDARVERIMNLQSVRNDYRRQIDRLEGEIEELEQEKLQEQAETAIAEAQLMDDFLKAAAPVIAEKVKNEGGSHRRGWVKGLRVVDELRALIPEEYQAVYEELDEIQQAATKRVEAEKPAAPALPLLNENALPDPVAAPSPKTEGNSATIESTFVEVPAFAPENFDEKAAQAMPGNRTPEEWKELEERWREEAEKIKSHGMFASPDRNTP